MSILTSFPVQAQTINQKQAKVTVQYASIPAKVETSSSGDIFITVKNISDDYRADYDMRVLNNKGNVVEVSEQNGGITYFSYLKKNRLYYYQIRETQTSAYPWEEDFTGEWTKKVPFVIAQYQLSQVGTGRKVRIKMPKISGVKSYKVYMSYKKDRAWKKLKTVKAGKSKIGYSFTIGIIAVILSYVLAIPLGILMARKKDKLIDQIGTLYIVFIIAVPSLAYIFLFKAIGGSMGLPTTFDMESSSKLMYILPIISLALPQVANLMKWLRRYMIDQMNSDYVKFARSGGLTENEIFTKHILKNAAIPIVQGVPASVLGALIGAIITERVYVVPGAGNLLTEAINQYDNGVIVGVTLFYALLSVLAIILGDILMSMVDPRISFSTKGR